MIRKCKTCGIEKILDNTNFRRIISRNHEAAFYYECKECTYKNKLSSIYKDNKLKCNKCKLFKNIDDFNINNANKYRHFRERRCKECKKQECRELRESTSSDKNIERIILERWLGAKGRAEKHNLEFTISRESIYDLLIKQDYKCALSGVSLTFTFHKGRVPTNMSIDKINPKGGYTKDNVQLVCMAVNQMKNDLSINQLLEFCKKITQTNENKNN